MNSERDFQNQWHEFFITQNLKLIAFAYPDESMALLLHIPITAFFPLCFGRGGGDHTIQK